MSNDPYGDRGNKDWSVGNAKGQGSIMPKASAASVPGSSAMC